jgi:3-oxoadipate enol-lactonase
MPFAEVAGVRLRYELQGPPSAPVVALSNSLGTDLSMWEAQSTVLSREFRVLRYNTRGQGDSSVLEIDATIETFAQDFIGLIDALGLRRVSFCGLSMGGMIGMWLGVHAPERLHALVLSNTAVRIGTKEMWNARISNVRAGGMLSISEAVIQLWFTPEFQEAHPRAVESAKSMLEASPVEGYVSCCAAIRDMDQSDSIARIQVRTLVMSGAKDAVTPTGEARFLVDRIAGSRLVELQAAHLSNIERPDEFNSSLTDFFRG